MIVIGDPFLFSCSKILLYMRSIFILELSILITKTKMPAHMDVCMHMHTEYIADVVI